MEIDQEVPAAICPQSLLTNLPTSHSSHFPRLSSRRERQRRRFITAGGWILKLLPTAFSFWPSSFWPCSFWPCSPSAVSTILASTTYSLRYEKTRAAANFERGQPPFLSLAIYIMQSVFLWIISAILQASLVASAPLGPTGPCADVRASTLNCLDAKC